MENFLKIMSVTKVVMEGELKCVKMIVYDDYGKQTDASKNRKFKTLMKMK